MTSDAATSATPWAFRWGRVLTAVSIVGTILAVLSVFLLTLLAVLMANEFDGSNDPTWWFWLIAVGFAIVGSAGLLLTSRTPTSAYLLRVLALLPLLALGLVTPWLMLPVILVGGADLSMMVSHWSQGQRPLFRASCGVVTAIALAVLVLPVVEEPNCENPGDPPASCEIWYSSFIGSAVYEEDERDLLGWGLLAVLGGLIVALPVALDTRSRLV